MNKHTRSASLETTATPAPELPLADRVAAIRAELDRSMEHGTGALSREAIRNMGRIRCLLERIEELETDKARVDHGDSRDVEVFPIIVSLEKDRETGEARVVVRADVQYIRSDR